MRVLFLGLPLAAHLLLRDGHALVHACLCRPGYPGERRVRQALGEGRVDVRPDLADAATAVRLAALAPDLLVSWYWTTRVPKTLMDAARLGSVGVHPSLLPRHRGPDPCFWAIDRGDTETGVTAHGLAEDYDTGPLLAQRRLAIDPTWDAWTLARRLDRPSLSLLREVVGNFARGAPPQGTVQDESQATAAPAPDEEALEIDWHASTHAIARRVRAAAPWPGAYTFLGDEAIVLTKVATHPSFPRALAPGEGWIAEAHPGGAPRLAAIRAGDGALALLAGRTEDDMPLDAEGLARRVSALAPRSTLR